MSYYKFCSTNNIIRKAKHLLDRGGYFLRDVDGKINCERRLAYDTPWHHVRHHRGLDCMLWHTIMYDGISKTLPAEERFVPSKCQNCYKVVVKPKTLAQLFALLDMQRGLNLPSKCGIEVRTYVPRLYGGYFYNLGLQEGLECYAKVRDAVDSTPLLGPGIDVILKRACTEYEMECGPSDKWVITEKQMQYENMVETYFCADNIQRDQTEHTLWEVHQKWIEFAFQNGDETYKKFTDGESIYEPYVTYHHLIKKVEDDKTDGHTELK